MFMFMLRLSAGALSVSACALSVRRAQRPRAQSNRRAAATGIVHWAQRAARTGRSAQLGAHAGPSNRLLAQHSQVLRCVWRLYEVIAEQNDPESFSLVSLTLASENPTPPTRDVESWPRHSSPPSDAVSTPLALQSPVSQAQESAAYNSGPGHLEGAVHGTGWSHALPRSPGAQREAAQTSP